MRDLAFMSDADLAYEITKRQEALERALEERQRRGTTTSRDLTYEGPYGYGNSTPYS